jgi:hypothetical protein
LALIFQIYKKVFMLKYTRSKCLEKDNFIFFLYYFFA